MARPPNAAAVTRWSRWGIGLVETADGLPLCLSLANMLHFRNSGAPRENLHGYSDVVEWAMQKKILAKRDAARLVAAAAARRAAAQREFARTIALREAIARVFAANARRRTPEPAAVAVVVASFNEAAGHLKLALDDGRIVPCLDDAQVGLALPRWQAALSAVGLLSSASLVRVKQCADDRGCGWLFVDTTKNGSRRYCFSRECGNRARQAKFRARHRPARAPAADARHG